MRRARPVSNAIYYTTDDKSFPHQQITPGGLTKYLPFSTNLRLLNNCRLLYFLNNFLELNVDGLADTSFLLTANLAVDLHKIRLLVPYTTVNEGPPQQFQKMFAIGLFKSLFATEQVQVIFGDITFFEKFSIKTSLDLPLSGPFPHGATLRYQTSNSKLYSLLRAT